MSLGMGVIAIVLEILFTQAQGHYNNLPVYALQVANLASFGQVLGIITGTVLFRIILVFMELELSPLNGHIMFCLKGTTPTPKSEIF